MPDSPRILVIEDEPQIRKFLRASLQASAFHVIEAGDGSSGMRSAKSQPPDVVLLDLGLPDVGGFEVIKQLRGWLQAPIIVLSARGQESDKIAALDLGADDYLTKPFSVGELLARLRAALRRASRSESGESTFSSGQVHVDFDSRQVHVAGAEVHLTPTEFRLLATLIKHAGKVITHRQLLSEVWGPGNAQETHYVRVYVNQLRQKLGDSGPQQHLIQTEPGIGYRLRN